MKPLLDLRTAFDDPQLLQPVMGGASRLPMRSVLLASQGEELTDEEREHFHALTGREREPCARVEECHIIAGRRSGKSSGVAALGVYVSALCDFSDRLSPGERGVVLVVAENQKQAKILLRYIEGAFAESPVLRRLIVSSTQTSLSLSNNIDIEVRAADFRGLRGLTLICAIAEEIAFWRSEDSARPDFETIDAIRPALVTTRGQLFSLGSPYRKTGFQYKTFAKNFGSTGDPLILVAKGPTRSFNATVPQTVIDRAIERDAQAASAEWLGNFRDDISGLLSREIVEACVIPGRYEIPRISKVSYTAFCDPSGGASDDMTLAIAHAEGQTIVLDCVRARKPPFNPNEVVEEFSAVLKAYGLATVRGDRYAGEWPVERFKAHGIRYEAAQKPKSAIYLDSIPIFSARRVELLDNKKLIAQIIGLERRTARGGRDSIDHAPGAHDDIANAVCGALTFVVGRPRGVVVTDDFLNQMNMHDMRVRQPSWGVG